MNFILFLLCFQGALISFNISSIAGIVPAMSEAFGVPDFTMCSIIVAYMVPYGIAALLYGPLSRVVNTKRITLSCLSVFSLSSFSFRLALPLPRNSVCHTDESWTGVSAGCWIMTAISLSVVKKRS